MNIKTMYRFPNWHKCNYVQQPQQCDFSKKQQQSVSCQQELR